MQALYIFEINQNISSWLNNKDYGAWRLTCSNFVNHLPLKRKLISYERRLNSAIILHQSHIHLPFRSFVVWNYWDRHLFGICKYKDQLFIYKIVLEDCPAMINFTDPLVIQVFRHYFPHALADSEDHDLFWINMHLNQTTVLCDTEIEWRIIDGFTYINYYRTRYGLWKINSPITREDAETLMVDRTPDLYTNHIL